MTTTPGGFGIGVLVLLAACTAATPPAEDGTRRTAGTVSGEDLRAAAAVAPAAGPPTTAETVPVTDCRELPAALLEGREGIVLPVVPLDAATPLRLDLPGLERVAAAPAGRCLLLVDRVVAGGGELVETGRETVESRRRVGSRRQLNPEYERIERELAEARAEARRRRPAERILSTGDPALDLVGLVAETVLAGGRILFGGDRVAELEAKLAETPPFVEVPVVHRYRYELRRFAGRRSGSVRAALLDPRRGGGWTVRVALEERREFAVVRGRDPGDDTPLPPGIGEPVDPETLEAWRQAPPMVPASVLLRHLRTVVAAPPQPFTRERLLAAWGEAPPATVAVTSEPPQHSPSVVLVRRGGETVGLGFYVTPETIVTRAGFLGESILVPVEAAPGLVTYGVVEARDPESDLALVWLPRSGPPLKLAADGTGGEGVPWLPVAAGSSGPRGGAPLMAGREVVGIAGDTTLDPPVPLVTLRAFLDRLKTGDRRASASR